MRGPLQWTLTLALAGILACADSSPVGPRPDDNSGAPDVAPSIARLPYESFTLRMVGSEESPSEAWGVLQVRTGLVPALPCAPIGLRLVRGFAVCGVMYNPGLERFDAMTFEVDLPGGTAPFRGFLDAPPNPCTAALIRGVFPAEASGATAVYATLETDAGIVVTDGPDWPGAIPSAPPNPCVITVMPG